MFVKTFKKPISFLNAQILRNEKPNLQRSHHFIDLLFQNRCIQRSAGLSFQCADCSNCNCCCPPSGLQTCANSSRQEIRVNPNENKGLKPVKCQNNFDECFGFSQGSSEVVAVSSYWNVLTRKLSLRLTM